MLIISVWWYHIRGHPNRTPPACKEFEIDGRSRFMMDLGGKCCADQIGETGWFAAHENTLWVPRSWSIYLGFRPTWFLGLMNLTGGAVPLIYELDDGLKPIPHKWCDGFVKCDGICDTRKIFAIASGLWQPQTKKLWWWMLVCIYVRTSPIVSRWKRMDTGFSNI